MNRNFFRYRLAYSKQGRLRFVSHRDMIQVLSRALRRSAVPLRYTQGFSPRPKLSFAPPLPLGVEGARELLDIELTNPVDERDMLDFLNHDVPDGLLFRSVRKLLDGAPGLSGLIHGCRYSFEPTRSGLGTVQADQLLEADNLPVTRKRNKDGRERRLDLRPLLLDIRVPGAPEAKVLVDVRAAPETIPPFEMAALLWPDLDGHPLEACRIERLGFLTEEGHLICRKDERLGK